MGEFATLVGELLSQLHVITGLPVCPGDWVWTTTAAGLVLAVFPVVAATGVTLVRRFRGNRYTGGIVALFALLGVTGMAVLPLLGFTAVSTALRRAALGIGSSGLTGRDLSDLQDAYCFLPPQASYLGGGRSVSDALAALPGPDWLLAGRAVVLLITVPLFVWLVTWLLARLTVRRGPAWPARLLWLPFLGLLAGTLPLDEGVVGQLWLGYLAGLVAGLFLVLLIGRPRWSVINRPEPPPAPRAPRPRVSPRAQVAEQPRAPEPPAAARPQPLPATLALPGATGPDQAGADQAGADQAGPDQEAGRTRFHRLRRLGEGGFGDVWLALDTALDREVAIKVARAADPETERRIQREARALAAVDHPHCVRVYDILPGLAGLPGLAIVMEYVPGPSLARQVAEQGPLSDTAGAYLWFSLAGALAAAHARGVLHRDVKPANVIIDRTGQAHLIDFGIARTAGDPTMTATGLVIGTPDYLSPEVAEGAAASPGTDSWQLAATVSYALSGHPPRGYRDSAVAALRAAASREPAMHLPRRSAHCGLLQRALHLDPRQRPNLAEVQAHLAEWLARTGRPAAGPVTRTLATPPQI